MSVLIKGVYMPKNCGECYFLKPEKFYVCWCYAGGFPIKPGETDLRDGMCPLVALPEHHGRLVDMDEVYGAIDNLIGEAEGSTWGKPLQAMGSMIGEYLDIVETMVEAEE